jgi:hypothetical protein
MERDRRDAREPFTRIYCNERVLVRRRLLSLGLLTSGAKESMPVVIEE